MAWFILGISIYYLVLLSERVLVGLSVHQLEQIQRSAAPGSRYLGGLVADIRPALSGLLLARIFLKVIISVFPAIFLANSDPVRSGLYNWALAAGVPVWAAWAAAATGYALLMALIFWGLKKANWPVIPGHRTRIALQRLAPFILFWKVVFSPPFPKTRRPRQDESSLPAPASSPAASGPAGDKQRDIELLKSIVKFSDVTVKQVMQPRSKVVAVDFRTSFGELLTVVRQAGFSRLPVYDEDLDNVTGILYVKDLVSHLDQPDDFEWQSLIRTNLQLVPEAKRVSELLQEFKRNRRHMAIVVDEYGGSSGIVTMEDILEEITGEIRDEFDEESEIRYRKLDDRNYLFEGQTLLNDVCRIAGLAPGAFDNVRGASDTLAGLALELKGDIPKPGAEFTWNGFQLIVVAANNRRIEQLKLTLLN